MKALKSLIVEDSNDDAELLLRHLTSEGYAVQATVVQTPAEMKAALDAEADWDVVLSDYSMPNFTGLDALSILKESGQDIPVIIISGTIGEDAAVEAMVVGVHDYLMKGNLARLAPAIEREVENAASRRTQQKAEKALRHSETILADAQRIAHIGSWDWDVPNNKLFWSEEVYRIFGRTKTQFAGTFESFLETVHPDDRQKVQAAVNATLTRNAPYNHEHRIIRPDGEERIVCEIGELSFDESGKPLRFIGTVQDITERKTIETGMRLMKRAFDSITEGVLICDAQQPDYPTIYTNAAFENLTGYAFDEIVGRNCRFLQGAETNRRTVDEIREAIKKEKTFHGEILNYRKDGTPFWNELGISPVFDGSERLTHFVGIQQDVTERKRDEAELVRLAIVARKTQNAVIICDADGCIQWVNEGFTRLTGYEFDEVVGNLGYFLQGEKTDAEMVETIRATMWAREHFSGEIYNYKKDGTGFWISISITPTFEESGEVQGFVAVQMDITERKQAEEKLRASEANLAAAQRITHLGSWEVELQDLRRINNNKVHWSEEVYRIFGYEPGEVAVSINRYFDSIHPDDRKNCRKAFIELITDRKDLNINFRIGLPAGGERILHGLAEVIYDGQTGEPQKIIGTVQDITDRKLAEEALKQSERDYRAVFEQAHDAILIFAPEDEIVLDVNERACEIYGFSRSEFVGKSIEALSKYPANGKDKVEETLKVGEYLNFETVQYRKDGSEMFLDINASKIIYQGRTAIMTINRDITERKLAGEAVRKAEARYRNLVELSPAIVYLAEPHPPYAAIYVSPNIKVFGYQSEEWLSRDAMWLDVIHEEDRARVLRITENAMNQGLDTDIEYRIVGRDKKIFWVHDKGCFISDERGNKIGWQGVILDITETKGLEDQLRQSQKLESVGLLAGGIAHDFNNMLTAINGYGDLTLRQLKEDDPLRFNIKEIIKAGLRSADLTQQLLAFSRQQVLHPEVLDINEAITDTIKILQRLIGEDIRLDTVLNHNIGRIKVDPGQLSQIIMNLSVNARDAMPRGGKITIETKNVFLEPDYTRQHVGILPGAYVMLSISDTGVGMNDETKQHIYEPFFTTKPIGQGTGLGLATVYGIVKQSGGSIFVDSKEGIGTTFEIYFPRIAERIEVTQAKEISAQLPRGIETILLVEDEKLVRNLSREILKECGYTVIEAANGVEALSICESGKCKFDLLMTDVVMPQMGGRELAETLTRRSPDLLILFASGYTDDNVVRYGVIEANTNFIQKPFTPAELAGKIREILDNSQAEK